MRLSRMNLRPRGPGNLTNIDVAPRVDSETMWREELAGFVPSWCFAEAADELASMIGNTDTRPEIWDVTADSGGRADFADVADRLVTVWHVETARAVQVLPLRLVFAVAVEDLDAMVLTVGDVHPAVGVGAHDVIIGLAGFTVALFFLGFAIAPLWTATMDIAPDYAGSSSALMNAAGAVAGILSPVAFGWMLDRTGSWTTPFAVSVGLLLFAIVMTHRIRPDRPIDTVSSFSLAVAGE
jgi:MFS family permease